MFNLRLAVVTSGDKVIDSVVEPVKIPARRVGTRELSYRNRRDEVVKIVAQSRITLSHEEQQLLTDVPGLADLSHPPVLAALELALTAANAGDDFRFFGFARAAGLSRGNHHHFHSMLVTADLAEIERRLSAHRGMAVKMLRPQHTGIMSIESHFCELRNPILLMELAWTSRSDAALSDRQFEAVAHLLPKAHSGRTWREWFDRLFHLTRDGFAIGSGQLLGGVARKAFRKLHHGGLSRKIIAIWLEMEGWNIPSDFAAGPIFCRSNPSKYLDPDMVRRELAESLGISSEEAARKFADRRTWIPVGPCQIDVEGGRIRDSAGVLTEFVMSGSLGEMFRRPGEWVKSSIEHKTVLFRAYHLRRKLFAAG